MCFGSHSVKTEMKIDRIVIRNSRFGKGLFAKKDIEPGTVLCKATGKELNFQKTLDLEEKESHTSN
jgi:hypothetical protein